MRSPSSDCMHSLLPTKVSTLFLMAFFLLAKESPDCLSDTRVAAGAESDDVHRDKVIVVAKLESSTEIIRPGVALALTFTVTNTTNHPIVVPKAIGCNKLLLRNRNGEVASCEQRLIISTFGEYKHGDLISLKPRESAGISLSEDIRSHPAFSDGDLVVCRTICEDWRLRPGLYTVNLEWTASEFDDVKIRGEWRRVGAAFSGHSCNVEICFPPIIVEVKKR